MARPATPTAPTDQLVTIGIDPHRGSHTAAALDPARRGLDQLTVPASPVGYRQLRAWAARWPHRRWGVEGASGNGRVVSQWLLADGEQVVDIPAKLSARVRLLSTGHNRKSDEADAISTARAACDTPDAFPVAAEGASTTLRLLSDRRDDLVARRTQSLNRLHALLGELAPGQARQRLSAESAAVLLRKIRPAAGPAQTRRRLAADLVREVRQLDTAIRAVERDITDALGAAGSTLPQLYGIGTVIAAKILGRVGDVRRFATSARFASYCGVAPIAASSGDVVRHRLSRAGDRQLNFALHVMATCQARQHPAGRAYYLRKRAEGHAGLEALRCLKRQLADVVYRQLLRDAHAEPAAVA